MREIIDGELLNEIIQDADRADILCRNLCCSFHKNFGSSVWDPLNIQKWCLLDRDLKAFLLLSLNLQEQNEYQRVVTVSDGWCLLTCLWDSISGEPLHLQDEAGVVTSYAKATDKWPHWIHFCRDACLLAKTELFRGTTESRNETVAYKDSLLSFLNWLELCLSFGDNILNSNGELAGELINTCTWNWQSEFAGSCMKFFSRICQVDFTVVGATWNTQKQKWSFSKPQSSVLAWAKKSKIVNKVKKWKSYHLLQYELWDFQHFDILCKVSAV